MEKGEIAHFSTMFSAQSASFNLRRFQNVVLGNGLNELKKKKIVIWKRFKHGIVC